MNTRKRYLALAATAIICTASLPLGAMKQPDQQKNNRVTPKMVFLQAVEKQDLDYIKNNITSMDPTTLQTALNALQDFQESEMYTFIANYVSPQPPQNDKKRKREDENDTTPQENEQEEIKKRKIQEKIILKAAKEDKIGTIMPIYKNMSDETISKTIDLVQEFIKIKKEKKEIKSDYESKVARFLYNQLNSRNKTKELENNTPQTDDSKKNALECGVCTEKFEQNECIIKLDCNLNASHYFHPDCIKKWAKTAVMGKKRKKDSQKFICNCPICKKEHLVEDFLTTEEINTYDRFTKPNSKENAQESFNMILSSQEGIIGTQEINEFCGHIIQKNYWDIVKKLVSTNLLECLNDETLEKILDHALEKNDPEIIERLFSDEGILHKFSEDTCENIFKWATENENLPAFQEFFKPENRDILKNIDKNTFRCAFESAAKKDSIKIVQEFFKTANRDILNDIDKRYLKSAFRYAAEKGHLNIIQEFFKPENRDILNDIDKNTFRCAFESATENGHLNIIQEFFKPENRDILKNIDKNTFRCAFKDAAKKGHLNIIQEFFKPENRDILKNIDKNTFECAFDDAAKKGSINIVLEFFKTANRDILNDIDELYLESDFKYAAEKGHLSIVQEFFKPENKKILEKISPYYLGWALKEAAKNGHLSIVQEFFKPENKKILEKIPPYTLGWALEFAAENGHLNIVQEFFKPENKKILEKIPPYNLRDTLKEAAKNGRLDIVQELLNNDIVLNNLSNEELKEAFDLAKTDEIKNEINKHISYLSYCDIQ